MFQSAGHVLVTGNTRRSRKAALGYGALAVPDQAAGSRVPPSDRSGNQVSPPGFRPGFKSDPAGPSISTSS